MRVTTFKLIFFITLMATAFLLGGCGAFQFIGDTASEVGKAVFYAKVKVLRLDFTARESLNLDEEDRPLSVMIRVYQLKDGKNFDGADYATLYSADREFLAQDLLAIKEFILPPGGAVSLSETMDDGAGFVGVAAFFREEVGLEWKMLLTKGDLFPDKPLRIEAVDFSIAVLKEE